MAEASLSFYEYSKQIVAQEHPMDPIIMNKKIIDLSRQMLSYRYIMLLCHERRDYTIFNLNCASTEMGDEELLTKEISETLNNRGQVLLIDEQPDGAYEIWIRDVDTQENFCYYLFNYTEGVIEI